MPYQINMTKMEIMEPVESQQLYEFILNNKTKLPPTYKIRNMTLMAEQLREVYDMVATNRAKTRGTRLYFETDDDGDVSKIEYAEIKVAPENIPRPRPKDKRDINEKDNPQV